MAMVLSPRNQARLDAAAGPTLESIRRDRQLAPRELKPLFAYVEAHLFDHDFSVGEMRRACDIGDNSVSTRFRHQTGMRLRDYVREHRLRVARELLKYDEPEISLVAEMLGFSSAQVLSRNFIRRFEIRPRDHRKAHAVSDPGAAGDSGSIREDFSAIELRRALEGRLEPGRGRALVRELSALYPPEGEAGESPSPAGDLAAAIWERMRRLAPEEESPAMREELAAACREVFELLCERSRIEGRKSRQRGVRLAELALRCLDVCASVLGDELPGLKALGWARLGNAQRLALDFTAAEASFRKSAFEWSSPHGRRIAGIEAEILALKAAFRTMQHRFAEAKELTNEAIDRLQSELEPRLLAETLILRAIITDAEGEPQASIADLTRALELLDELDSRLRLTVCHNLATAYMIAGRFADAAELLGPARELCSIHGESLEQFQLKWVEGRVAKGLGQSSLAEERFHAFRAGFEAAGETAHATVVSMELALIYCEQGRPEAAGYAAEAIPLLDGFKFRSEALAARRLLLEALARERLTPEILREVRLVLCSVVWDPAVRLPSELGGKGTDGPAPSGLTEGIDVRSDVGRSAGWINERSETDA